MTDESLNRGRLNQGARVSDESTARRIGAALREDGATGTSLSAQDQELARLLRTVRAIEKPRPTPRLRLAALAALAGMVAVLAVVLAWPASDLTYVVHGVARIEGRRVSAEAGEPVQLQFSDGSRVELASHSKLRVDARTPEGAALSVLDGTLLATVRHRAHTHWRVSAGPFVIKVVGTRFRASWHSAREHLTVELYQGAVEVEGSSMPLPVSLRAGQRLEADAVSPAVRILPLVASSRPHGVAPATPLKPEGKPEAESQPKPESPSEPQSVLPSASVPAPPPSWTALMARGDFAAIVAQAKRMGIARCLMHCTPEDLRILADAARYAGDNALAENGLLSLRRRDPAQAHVAGFFLGRMYESQGRNVEALSMYQRYLAEASHGDYAEESAVGCMRNLARTGDKRRAQEAARRYLASFPGGVHAALATRLLVGQASP